MYKEKKAEGSEMSSPVIEGKLEERIEVTGRRRRTLT